MKVGSKPIQSFRIDAATGEDPITFAAWIALDAAINADVSRIQIQNGTDQDLRIGLGAVGVEQDVMFIHQGAATTPSTLDGFLVLPKDVRLAVRALAADTTTGTLIINLWG